MHAAAPAWRRYTAISREQTGQAPSKYTVSAAAVGVAAGSDDKVANAFRCMAMNVGQNANVKRS
jgi:hypothetical protein